MHAERGEPISRRLQARTYLAGMHACDTSVEVTSTAHQLVGGAAIYRGSRLLRALSDVQAARQHLLFSHQHLSELGKLIAGLDVVYPPYGQPPVSSIPLPLTSVRRFEVVAALEERGHRAHAIDLPGHEADSTPAATVTLEDDVRAIGAALRARGGITQ